MAKTQADLQWEKQCYGCTEQELRNSMDNDLTARLTGGYEMVVASLLSNAQEEIEFGMTENARQSINVAKFVLFNYMKKETV